MTLDLARWQFALTSINHFFFVPVTIGLAFLVAMLQTSFHRTNSAGPGGRPPESPRGPELLRLTRFFGTLLVINVAIGVVTGLVQEFEFGMNWSAYSRMVGNVFGAPLAMEGLAAFFLESTFLGLWVFGWDKLSRRVHLLTIWLVFAGTILSAAFILSANSWMQHPVGYKMVHGQPQLTDIWAVLTNPVFLWGFTHVVLDSIVTGAAVMLAVSAWQLRRQAMSAFRHTLRLSLAILVPVLLLDMFVGSELGVIEARYQPMKIAAAEAQWTTCQPCSFSLFQIGGGNNDHTPTQIFSIPHLLSLLATNSWNGKVIGLSPLQSQYAARYGPGNYVPNVFIQYWSMRVMAYLAGLLLLLGLAGLLLMRKKRVPTNRWFLFAATWAVVTPFGMNTAGWLLTESGRQPWVVQGILLTRHGVSPSVSFTDLLISLIAFGLLYTALGVIDAVLMIRYSRRELAAAPAETESDAQPRVPSMLY
ncbi:MAG TPA: cytochrome ubiquinol oxidase subunit I [Streptosporangiaceae bacterium]|nr:cytochrome ubiquinol oxidase subunit I [Streptosporangiaceae bacterium]